MEPKDYIVVRIEGDYAYLRLLDGSSAEELFIALALLPFGTDVGTKLRCDMPDFTIL
ncbi:MAG: hypothetical protein IJP11_04820 [Oscillospiraceae bacterium]|nr:hypothetical protein [Oscillospiraceae bacterium]